ncbi:MAG: TlpA family protein disulfide reductase [Blastocatellia bacterium]|nr:TlpA family protein disulfide reductase [Blastocatellia bacterium]
MKKCLTEEKTETGYASIILLIGVCLLVVAAGLVLNAVTGASKENEDAGYRQSKREHQRSQSVKRAKPSTPDFNLKDISGKEVKLSDFKGKVVVVNFWATWCGPCVAEIPSFVKLREQYHGRGLEIIGISLDRDSPERVARFAKKFNMNYPVVMGTQEAVASFGSMDAIPTTFIIDRRGQVHSRHIGLMSFNEAENEILPLL